MNSPVNSISNARLRDTLRETGTPGVAQKSPKLMPDVAKRASLGRDREVAGGDELAAGRGRDAVHARDDRLRQRCIVSITRLQRSKRSPMNGLGAIRHHLLQVVPAGERAALRRR